MIKKRFKYDKTNLTDSIPRSTIHMHMLHQLPMISMRYIVYPTM